MNSPFYPDAFAYIRIDAFGEWVVLYLGPPFTWNGVVFEEPEVAPAMCTDAVLSNSVTWPEPEEEE